MKMVAARSLHFCSALVVASGKTWLRLGVVACLITSALLGGSAASAADRGAAQQPQYWAILIGAQEYQHANPLRFTADDVSALAETLQYRGDFAKERVLKMSDGLDAPELKPTKSNIEAQLTAWLKKPTSQDTVLVYFSGHGVRDAEGKLYLAPVDCRPANLRGTGISIEWFRAQITGCRAAFKLLVLDACHAGSEKGDPPNPSLRVAGEELGAALKQLSGVVTIASCRADEMSVLWEEKQQSLFSYWMNQALKGHADASHDGKVDIDELYRFISQRVKQTAHARLGFTQNPVRIVGPDTFGVPPVVRLKPQELRILLADIADQLAYALQERRIEKVGVLGFSTQTELAQVLGREFGGLSKYCRDQVEQLLSQRGITLVDHETFQAVLKEQSFSLADRRSPARLLALSKNIKKSSKGAETLPVVVLGTLESRDFRDQSLIHVSCKLVQTESNEELGVIAGGTAALNVDEWAMGGHSAVVRAEDRRPENRPPGASVLPISHQVIERLEERVAGPKSHPLQDPTFPFGVQLVINGKVREGEFRGNDFFVPVREGESYEIRVENRSERVAMMRLLIDGLNTLPEKERNEKGVEQQNWGSHVNLSEARAWVLDPERPGSKSGPPAWTISGFATQTGRQGVQRQFVFTDAAQSLAARQQFTDEVGLITAAFYVALQGTGRRGPSGLGTAAGHEMGTDLTEREGFYVGNLIGVVHIRYVDEAALSGTR